MSQADIETLRAVYQAVSRGDWDAALREAPSDFEFKTPDRVTSPGTYRGGEEVRQFFEDLWGAFEEVVAEPEEFFERGDQVVVFLLMHLRPRGSSAAVDMRVGHLWRMRDGKPVWCEVFPERGDALEAAGLSDQDSGG